MNVLNTLSPIFIIIAVGAVLRYRNFWGDDFTKGLTRLNYWVALPTLLFYKIATSTYTLGSAVKTYYVVAGGMLACILLAIVVCKILKVPAHSRGAFIQGAYRGNLVYIGLPVVIMHAITQGGSGSLVEQNAVLALSMIIPTYNITAVTVLIFFGVRDAQRKLFVTIAHKLITNPLIIACVLGICYRNYIGHMPLFLAKTSNALGMMALPLALLAIGAALVQRKRVADFHFGLSSTFIKVFFAPLAGLLLIKIFGLSFEESQTAMIFLACPTAVSSYVLAEEMGSDKYLAAAIVVLTCMLSIVSLSFVIHFIS